jgi:phospho-N-acetylmuramoyl-pentapeptide-transferase
MVESYLPQYLQDPQLPINVLKIMGLAALSFILAIFLTPFLTHFLYKHKLWKKNARKKSIDGKEIPIFEKFHQEGEVKIPRFGGILVWLVPLILAVLFFFLSKTNLGVFKKLNFLSRSQTWLPLFALVAASLIGLLDDILQVRGKGKYIGGGLSVKYRLISVFLIGLVGGWWFFEKLGWKTLHIPGIRDFYIGPFYIPLFIIVMMATYIGGVIDGLDGLAGGAFSTIFAAYGVIAFFQGQINLATFCAVLWGAILAFLWFNIPPARFYMGETGMMALCAALTVVAFLTDSVLVLPIIGILLVIEAASILIQLFSKKFFKRKVFLAAPIHHHFEARGWPAYKVTMRFWVIGMIAAIVGVAIRLLG